MTVNLAPGSAASGDNTAAGNAGTQTQTTDATAAGSPGAAAGGVTTWHSGLQNADNRAYAEKKGWADLDAALTSYRSLETEFSKRAPANIPKSAAEYSFGDATGLPSGMTLDNGMADAFKQTAHKMGLTADQAKGVYDMYVQHAATAFGASGTKAAEARQKSIDNATLDLTTAWGAMDGPAFTRNVEMARRAIANLDPGLKDALVQSGVIVKNGATEVVANAAVLKALAKAGNSLYAEDQTFGTSAQANNPFEAKHENLGLQSRMITTDPDKAEMMIRAAGPDAVKRYAHWLNDRSKKR